MEKSLTFDDVLIKPKFSKIQSRKDVSIASNIGSLNLTLPIISANMDTVTNNDVAEVMYMEGGIACLHRFLSIEENILELKQLTQRKCQAIVSVGLGEYELERAFSLIENNAKILCIDVAHGAQLSVVEQYNKIKKKYKDIDIIVGNFATGESILQFRALCSSEPLAFKVGIGGGAACLTRVQTGCGIPQLSSIIDSVKLNPKSNIISDGGCRYPGDIAKALAVGAKAVMLGSMLAGCDESPGEIINGNYKKYRGSASQESYEAQGKKAQWRTYEGDSFLISYKGPLKNVLNNIQGGIRSSFTYVGANNLTEFQQLVELVEISYSSVRENSAHGKI